MVYAVGGESENRIAELGLTPIPIVRSGSVGFL